MAALRDAVFPLSAKNRRGGHILPSSARVNAPPPPPQHVAGGEIPQQLPGKGKSSSVINKIRADLIDAICESSSVISKRNKFGPAVQQHHCYRHVN